MQLDEIGYSRFEAYQITKTVLELTDVYTSERFPWLNRKQRKLYEAIRLGGVSDMAKNVKFGDMIDNTSSIVQHDKNFAKTYLQEKIEMLSKMRNTGSQIYVECELSCSEALKELAE